MEGLLHFILVKIILLALTSSFASCYDPNPLQDYCVTANDTNGVFVNGYFCKDPRLVTANDFFASGLNIPGNTSNRVGAIIRDAGVERVPGVNTLGVGIARLDFAPGGQVPPHIHPRASTILLVIEGTLYVGFVSSNEYNNTLFSKILYPGDVFVFPIGVIQFHANIGKTRAVAIGAAGSQNPGTITVGDAVFGSDPPIDPIVLANAFALNVNLVTYLRNVFSFEDDVVNIFVNGKYCKDPNLVTAKDFFSSGLNIPGNTRNRFGSRLAPVNVERIPGLNTLGVAFARIDLAPGGQIPPHIHPRASEIFVVLQGKLLVGFVSSNKYNNTLFSKVLFPGDVFVFPIGLIQFHVNIGMTNAILFSLAGSQNPDLITVGDAVFGSYPLIDPKVLARAFALDPNIVTYLQTVFSFENGILS